MQPKIVTVLVCARTKQEDRKSSTCSKQTVSKSGVQAPYGYFPSMYIMYFGAGDFLGERLCFCSLQLRHIQNISREGGLGTVRYKSNKPWMSHTTEGRGPVQEVRCPEVEVQCITGKGPSLFLAYWMTVWKHHPPATWWVGGKTSQKIRDWTKD